MRRKLPPTNCRKLTHKQPHSRSVQADRKMREGERLPNPFYQSILASQKALHRESLRSWRKQKELLITHLIPHFFRMDGQGILHFFSFFFCGHFTFECFFMFVDFYTFMLSPRVQNKIPALRKIKFFKKIQCFKNIQIFKKFKFSK